MKTKAKKVLQHDVKRASVGHIARTCLKELPPRPTFLEIVVNTTPR